MDILTEMSGSFEIEVLGKNKHGLSIENRGSTFVEKVILSWYYCDWVTNLPVEEYVSEGSGKTHREDLGGLLIIKN